MDTNFSSTVNTISHSVLTYCAWFNDCFQDTVFDVIQYFSGVSFTSNINILVCTFLLCIIDIILYTIYLVLKCRM